MYAKLECPIMATMAMISDKWKVLIICKLKKGTLRFNELMRALQGVTQRVLTHQLRELEADVFVVASFGKILSKELIEIPPHKTLNVHPSLLPKLRGASPIQNAILNQEETGVTIIRMDEKVDHGPILAQEKLTITPWPDHYAVVEEKLGRLGGQMLGQMLPKWINSQVVEKEQKHAQATFTKMIEKEDGLLNLEDSAEINWRKVLAYSNWPGAYILFNTKNGKRIRINIKESKIENGQFLPIRVIPSGKKEMSWADFLRGN